MVEVWALKMDIQTAYPMVSTTVAWMVVVMVSHMAAKKAALMVELMGTEMVVM